MLFLEIIILLLAIPAGLIVAWYSRDELIQGRPWFKMIIIVSVVGVSWFWLLGKSVVSWGFGFILLFTLVNLVKSNNKKWVKEAFK